MKNKKSPALQMIHHVVENMRDSMGRSNEKTNAVITDCISSAIRWGLPFNLGDFKELATPRVASYYNTTLVRHDKIEEFWYGLSVGSDRGVENPSATQSIEHWLGRKPFLIIPNRDTKTPQRIHVGFRFEYQGKLVACTSFKDKDGTLTACSYKPHKYDERGAEKIDKRFTITHQDVRDWNAKVRGCD